MRRAALIGFPLGHTLSPVIHRHWAKREGIEASYDKVEAAPDYESFAAAAERLGAEGYRGANVTIPHKENALSYALDRGGASERARAAGAANMLTFNADGSYADNSDVTGFAAALAEVLTASDHRNRAILLGAGGAARGVALALLELGYGEIGVANRTPARAEALAVGLGIETVDWESRARALAGADLLVNATSLGMIGAPALEIDLAALPRAAIVADIVYGMRETALLRAARARGLRTVDGLSMLMHQAVPAYKAWLGREAVVDAALRAELEAAIAARSRP